MAVHCSDYLFCPLHSKMPLCFRACLYLEIYIKTCFRIVISGSFLLYDSLSGLPFPGSHSRIFCNSYFCKLPIVDKAIIRVQLQKLFYFSLTTVIFVSSTVGLVTAPGEIKLTQRICSHKINKNGR